MKLSKLGHGASILIGVAGIITALMGAKAGEGMMWGLSREHLFLCAGLLMLVAIWFAIGTIHHMKLEEKGEWF